MLEERPDYIQLRYIAADGREVVRMERLADGTVHAAAARNWATSATAPISMTPCSVPKGEGLHLGLRPQPPAAGSKAVSSVVRAAAPAYGDERATAGRGGGQRRSRQLFGIVSETVRQQSIHFIANRNGDYLYRPNRDKTFGFSSGPPLPGAGRPAAARTAVRRRAVGLLRHRRNGGQQFVADARPVYYDQLHRTAISSW